MNAERCGAGQQCDFHRKGGAPKERCRGNDALIPGTMHPGIAEQVLKVVIEARDADRPLTKEEDDDLIFAVESTNTKSETRGALKAVAADLTRQADARYERQRIAEEQRRQREHGLALENRRRRWQEISPTAAALYNALAEMPNDPALRVLAKYLLAKDRGPAPHTFEPELVPEHVRMAGFSV